MRSALSPRDRSAGAVVVVGGVLFQGLFLGRAAALLSVALVAAYAIWVAGTWSLQHPWLRVTYGVSLVVFLLHASEEYLHGFQRRLPALVGADRWSDAQFITFTVVWFVTFVAAAWAIRQRQPVGALVVLFFALAGGVGNGIAHLMLTLREGAYFPGTWTAPFCLLAGVVLLRQLFHK